MIFEQSYRERIIPKIDGSDQKEAHWEVHAPGYSFFRGTQAKECFVLREKTKDAEEKREKGEKRVDSEREQEKRGRR